MTQPPQPRRSRALVDTANPNLSPHAGLSSGSRKAINERQRRLAEESEAYDKWLDRMHHDTWPDWGKS